MDAKLIQRKQKKRKKPNKCAQCPYYQNRKQKEEEIHLNEIELPSLLRKQAD